MKRKQRKSRISWGKDIRRSVFMASRAHNCDASTWDELSTLLVRKLLASNSTCLFPDLFKTLWVCSQHEKQEDARKHQQMPRKPLGTAILAEYFKVDEQSLRISFLCFVLSILHSSVYKVGQVFWAGCVCVMRDTQHCIIWPFYLGEYYLLKISPDMLSFLPPNHSWIMTTP